MAINVINKLCPENHRCPMVRACPKGAIAQEGYLAPIIDSSKCVECMICVNNCPYGAFEK
ncbi:4Fe-4S binding protein [Candidatus Woesearchaeota archaeon]|nr:4Fe-4S binding protein [Candidatus Woesearchaeota archaeon]